MVNNLLIQGAKALDVLEGVDLSDKYVLVTGANCGIGYETARALALHNAHVTIACRNDEKANEARNKVIEEKPTADVMTLNLDLSKLASVKQCAEQYLTSNKPLNILILNAGVYNPPNRITDDGFEATFQVNHLAQFYLTNLLQERLIQSSPARVVIVSSDAQMTLAPMKLTDISWNKFSPTHTDGLNSDYNAYALSKLSNTLFAFELNERLKDEGITAYSLHPGITDTQIGRNSPFLNNFLCSQEGWGRPFQCTQEQGATTSVFCATSPNLEKDGGKYFSKCRTKNPVLAAQNPENATKLWRLSEEMVESYKTLIKEQNV